MFIVRQGDVMVYAAPKSVKPEPAALIARDRDRVVLAYGEVTGHAHAIHDAEADLFALPDTDDRFLRIMAASGVSLVHEEHASITIPPGDYIVRRQREYVSADMAPLQVAD
jgi:hypothetical protein